jgi:hypothetical protein
MQRSTIAANALRGVFLLAFLRQHAFFPPQLCPNIMQALNVHDRATAAPLAGAEHAADAGTPDRVTGSSFPGPEDEQHVLYAHVKAAVQGSRWAVLRGEIIPKSQKWLQKHGWCCGRLPPHRALE